MFDLEVEW